MALIVNTIDDPPVAWKPAELTTTLILPFRCATTPRCGEGL